MEALQVVVGAILVALGLIAYLRTRRLVQFVASLEEPPLSQAHRDRIAGIALAYHLIAGLTLLSGLAVVILAIAGG